MTIITGWDRFPNRVMQDGFEAPKSGVPSQDENPFVSIEIACGNWLEVSTRARESDPSFLLTIARYPPLWVNAFFLSRSEFSLESRDLSYVSPESSCRAFHEW